MSTRAGVSAASIVAKTAYNSAAAAAAVAASSSSSTCATFGRRYVALCTGILGFTGFIYWRYNISIRTTLLQSERRMTNVVGSGLQECRALLKHMETMIRDTDMKDRNDQIRALQLQNVEQTRSVARLEGAMKTCLIST